MTNHDAELDAIVEMFTVTGLLETFTDGDGKPAMRLTARGAQAVRAMAMAGEDADAEAVLNALLDSAEGGAMPG
jgi:hypothetical protein